MKSFTKLSLFLLLMILGFVTAKAQVSVSSTGGTPTGTYTTVSGAFTAINAGTHTGAIIVSVDASTTEPQAIVPLYASGVATASYTSVLIKPSVAGVTINSDAAPTSGKGILEFIGADNVTIDGSANGTSSQDLTILVNGTSTTTAVAAIRFAGGTTAPALGCNNVTIKNVLIYGSINTGGSANGHYGIVCASGYSNATNSSTFSSSGTGADYDNFTIQNNSFQKLNRAIHFAGTNGNPGDNLKILGNQMSSTSSLNSISDRGIFVSGTYGTGSSASTAALIEGNDIVIVSANSQNAYGIEVGANNQSITISKNKIHDCNQSSSGVWQMFGIFVASTSVNSNILIVNNMIWNLSAYGNTGSFNAQGINISGVSGTRIYFNSILMNGASVVNSRQYGIHISSSAASGLDIRNNAIVMSSTGTGTANRACIAHSGGTLSSMFAQLNNNVYNTANRAENVIAFNSSLGTAYASLSAWRTATGREANSLNLDPGFISTSDLHADPNSGALESKGAPIAGITTDFDGDTRNATTPDVGADEYNAILCSGTPAVPTHPTSIVDVCPNATANLVVAGVSTAPGVTYQWEESDDNGATDPWAAVTAGTGGTSTSYTTPAFVGAGNPPTIYYRLKSTCTTSGLTSESAGVQLLTLAPTTQASNIIATFTNNDILAISLTAGNGTRRAIYINSTNTFTAPINGAPLPAVSTVWGNAGQQLVADGAITTATVTGLAANTQYFFAVYEYKQCGATNIYSTAIGANNPIGITTCAPEVAPTASQAFNAPFAPSCWRRATGALAVASALNGTTSGGWLASTGFANTGANPGVRINLYSVKNDWFISPAIDLGATPGIYRVKYNMAVTSFLGTTAQTTLGTHKVDVVISTNGGATWSNANIIKTYTGAGTYSNTGQTETIDLTAYSGVVKIAFVATTTSNTPDIDFHIDNFVVEPIPMCFESSNLGVSGIADVSANLSWTAPTSGTPPTGYNWVVVPAGAGAAGTPVASGSGASTSASAMGLSPDTPYEFWVQTDCGSGSTSVWVGPRAFRTDCSSVTSFPYNEGFETTSPTISCWSVINGNNDFDQWAIATFSARTGTRCYNLNTDFNTSNQDYLVSPRFSLDATAKRLRFWVRAQSATEPDEISVKLSTTGKAIADFTTTLLPSTPVNTTNYVQYTVDLSAHVSSQVYIAFVRENAPADGWILFLDDVLIEDMPTCLEPTALVSSNVNTTSATISWTASVSNPSAGYQYEVRTSGAPGSGATGLAVSGTTPAGVTTASITGLTSDTDYFVYVLSDCGNGNTSVWTIASTFYTGHCKPIYTFGKTDGDLISEIIIVGTTLNNNSGTAPVNPAYTFFQGLPNYTADLQAGTSYTVSVTVGTFGSQNVAAWVDYNDNLVFEPSERIGFTTAQIGSNGSATFTISLSCSPPPGPHRLRVRDVYAVAGNLIDPCISYGYGETEDYIVNILPPPACPNPKNLGASSITATTANLTWDIGCTEAEWDVHVTTLGGGAPTGAASNAGITGTPTLALTGLTSLTGYEYWVRAVCTTGSVYSAWVGPFTFTTADIYCTPVYTFGKTDGDLISEIIISGTTLNNNSGTAPVNPSFTLFTGQPNYTADLQAGTSYTVSVTVGTYGSQNVAAWIDYNDNLTFEASEKIGFTTASIGANGSATFTITLSCAPPVGLHRMRIRDVFATAGNLIDPCASYGYGETEDYIINVLPPPPCPAPRNLAGGVSGAGQGTFTWSPGCTETEWDLHVTTLGGGAPTGAPNNPAVNSTTVTTTLPSTPALEYEYWVRASCGSGTYSSWSGPFVFMVNDEPCGAYQLVVGAAAIAQNTTNATVSTNDPNINATCSAPNNTVWFKFTPSSSGDYVITTSNPTTGSPLLSSWIFVYTTPSCSAGAASLTPIISCVQGCNGVAGNVANTAVPGLVAGQEYYIYVDGVVGSVGLFDIKVDKVSAYVNAKVLLANADPTSAIMDNYVISIANFPTSDPYAVAGAYNGNFSHINNPIAATVSPAVLATTGNNAIADWVFVELRQGVSGATTVIATKAALLQKDGDIVDTDGVSPLKFDNASPGNYFVAVRHRSHLGFRTSLQYTFTGDPNTTPVLNLSNNTVPLHGSTPNYSLTPTIYVMNGGDANSDGSVDAFDSIDWEAQNGLFDDYTNNADYNLDGSVDALDSIIWELHNGKFQEID
jgi:hypothetical protein